MQNLQAVKLRDFMTQKVVSVQLNDSMIEAYEKMNVFGIRHLPVVNDQNEVVGIFTQTDLNHACPPRETESGWQYSKSDLSSRILKHFIHEEPMLLSEEDSLGTAASVMARGKIGCIPVVKTGTKKLAGIITYVDVLKKIGQVLTEP